LVPAVAAVGTRRLTTSFGVEVAGNPRSKIDPAGIRGQLRARMLLLMAA
jgi:hypothetical protein